MFKIIMPVACFLALGQSAVLFSATPNEFFTGRLPARLQKAINEGFNVNVTNSKGQTPLDVAKPQSVDVLRKAGAKKVASWQWSQSQAQSDEEHTRKEAVERSRREAQEARTQQAERRERQEKLRIRREAHEQARQEQERRFEKATDERMKQLFERLQASGIPVRPQDIDILRRIAHEALDVVWSAVLDRVSEVGQLMRLVREQEEKERIREAQKRRVLQFLENEGGLQPNVVRATAPPEAFEICPICRDGLSDTGEEFLNYRTLCGHYFHASDLELHLRESGDVKCPICRQDVVLLPR